MTQIEKEIIKAIEKEPRLCGKGLTGDSLANSPIKATEVEHCLEWLDMFLDSEDEMQNKRVVLGKKRISSYGYKHDVEQYLRDSKKNLDSCYIFNGAMIAAIIAIGLPYEAYENNPYVYLEFENEYAPTNWEDDNYEINYV